MMSSATYVLVSVGALTVGLVLLRRWRSSRWGVCTLTSSLTGKLVIVTGGNVGLGAETALDLAKRGATVVLASRSEMTSSQTVDWIRQKTGNTEVHFMRLDLADLQSVRDFAGNILEKYSEIYCLVCNAGVWVPMEQDMKTSQGLEIHAGVNHLGHFLLTNLLLERLTQTSPSKVVVVSSGLSSQGKLDFDQFDHFKEGRRAEAGSKTFAPTGYCDSKLMNVLFSKELSERTAGLGLRTVSVCPGWCKTELARHVGIKFYQKILFLPIAFLFMRTAAQGAQNIIQAVVEDEDKLLSGGFYKDCKLASAENAKFDAMSVTGRRLWELSEELTGLRLTSKE